MTHMLSPEHALPHGYIVTDATSSYVARHADMTIASLFICALSLSKLAEELGREPTLDEVFLRTHIRKKDSSWVDLRSQNTYDSFQMKLNQASEGADESGSQMVDSATRLKMWAQSAGGKNRGRLYGVGDRSSNYRPGVSSLAPDTLEERAKAAEDEVRNTREQLRQAELKRQKEV
ncbi:uncharacterized protein LOC123892064 [Trifolium pratense]|uniref:uncharacterized protein LOC123892064 n=1 Tax=Trifolium pratense TaxID=57577 RepID=UPI001E696B9B|nr:uncharacterized protein LOC123892064 [Trifolium pratense]